MRMALRYLAEDLRARNITPSPYLLVLNIDRVTEAINNRFPGYMAAKMLHRVAPLVTGH
jgi:hypothetical protein